MKIYLLSLSFLFFCNGNNNDWSQEEKNAFMQNCIKNASQNLDVDSANNYCSCMLEKIIEEYPTPEEATLLTTDKVKQMTKTCLPE